MDLLHHTGEGGEERHVAGDGSQKVWALEEGGKGRVVGISRYITQFLIMYRASAVVCLGPYWWL